MEKTKESVGKTVKSVVADGVIDRKALHNITYGLFVLSARSKEKDNACITNTLCQVAENPLLVSIAVNKSNYTNELIQGSGIFNVSMISTSAKMDLFKRFGFVSGRDVDKFEDYEFTKRSSNGVFYITESTCSFLSASVVQTVDVGSHWLYIAQVTEAKKISTEAPCSYSFYLSDIKGSSVGSAKAENDSQSKEEKKATWVCKICGYVYEGDPLPADFICPICKHGAGDFEREEAKNS